MVDIDAVEDLAMHCGFLENYEVAGAMQGQHGTFGFHKQGESTRLKIYLYVTAI